MKSEYVLKYFVLMVVLFTSGCGTVCNTVWWNPDEGGQRAYGGTRADFQVATSEFANPKPDASSIDRVATVSLALLDIPFSAVGDTLTLPYILWLTASEPSTTNTTNTPPI